MRTFKVSSQGRQFSVHRIKTSENTPTCSLDGGEFHPTYCFAGGRIWKEDLSLSAGPMVVVDFPVRHFLIGVFLMIAFLIEWHARFS